MQQVDELFKKLGGFYCLENLTPLKLTKIEIVVLRNMLIQAGLKIDGLSQEGLTSLKETQFRNLEQGAGPGVVEVLGLEKAQKLVEYCNNLASGYGSRIVSKKTDEPIEGTQGRGLQQFAAKIIKIAVFHYDTEYVEKQILSINKAVLKGLRKRNMGDEQKLAVINEAFSSIDEPKKTMSSVADPEENVQLIWMYLTDRLD